MELGAHIDFSGNGMTLRIRTNKAERVVFRPWLAKIALTQNLQTILHNTVWQQVELSAAGYPLCLKASFFKIQTVELWIQFAQSTEAQEAEHLCFCLAMHSHTARTRRQCSFCSVLSHHTSRPFTARRPSFHPPHRSSCRPRQTNRNPGLSAP